MSKIKGFFNMKNILCFLIFCLTVEAYAQTFPENDIVVPWAVGLRIRENASTSAPVLGTLGLWENLNVIEQNIQQENIAGNTGNWVKVRRKNGQTGWCFGYYLVSIQGNDFFPILSWNSQTDEIVTFYNDNKKRDKLSLVWNNRQITNFPDMKISANGNVIAFRWIDPQTITRNTKTGMMTGKAILFAYTFSTHTLVKLDEANFSQYDRNSEHWKQEFAMEGYSDYFMDWQLRAFCINHDGSRIFYNKNDAVGIEFNLKNRVSTEHRLSTKIYHPQYIGRYLYLEREADDDEYKYLQCGLLYDPLQKRVVYDDFFSREIYSGIEFSVIGIINGRYLFIRKEFYVSDKAEDRRIRAFRENFKGIVVRDIQTGKDIHYPDDQHSDDQHSIMLSFDTDNIWKIVMDSSDLTNSISIQNIDRENNIKSQNNYNITIAEKWSSISYPLHPSLNGLMLVCYYYYSSRQYQTWVYYLLRNGDGKAFMLTNKQSNHDDNDYYPMY